MIAPAKRTHNVSEPQERFRDSVPALNPVTWQERYLGLLPRIRGQARRTFAALPRQLREEAVDEVVANTFVAYAALVRNGKEECAYATALTRYAVAQYRSGRRVGMSTNVRDVYSAKCQKPSGIRIQRVGGEFADSEPWDELLLDRGTFTPADAA